MNRIDETFRTCHDEHRKALVMFVSAGDPSLAFTEQLVLAISEAGADIIEIGVPFSDPMADGPAIQEASQRALKSGTTLRGIMAAVRRLREAGVTTPFVLFSYYNLILNYGIEALATDSREAGIDAWLIVDMPAEEEAEVMPTLREHGLYKITLLAPTTPRDRLKRLAGMAQGFVYYITVTGVTGVRDSLPPDLSAHLQDVASLSPIPLVAGFGVSSPEMARAVGEHTDGVVVGSKLVKTVADAPDEERALAEATALVRDLAAALHSDK